MRESNIRGRTDRRTAASIASGTIVSGGVAVIGRSIDITQPYPRLYHDPSIAPWALNGFKGALGEQVMEEVVTREFLVESGGWAAVPARGGIHGLDGVYLRVGPNDNLRPPMIAEAKYGGSTLGVTQDGLQMSERWIRPRLDDPTETAQSLIWSDDDPVVRRRYVPDSADVMPVPFSDGKANVWKEGGQTHVTLPDGRGVSDVRRQLQQVATMLRGTADGQVDYRARLFRYRIVDDEHEFTITNLTKSGIPLRDEQGTVVEQVISGSGDDLPTEMKLSLERSFRVILEDAGVPSRAARALAKHCVHNPSHAEALDLAPDGNRRVIGAVVEIGKGLGISVLGGVAAAAGQVARQLIQHGEIDSAQIGRYATTGMASAGAAYATGGAVQSLLVNTSVGQHLTSALPIQHVAGQSIERVIGTAAGAMVGSVVFMAGMHLFGEIDARQSKRIVGRSAARILASKGATATALSGAAALGTASTGTSIATLSGAAAQNAALAWWGGGSLASGGFGMTGGMVVLGGIGTVAAAAAFAATGYVLRKMDEAEQREVVSARLSLVAEKVANQDQVEWT